MVQKKDLKVLILCGPTAAGKTEAAVTLAERFDAEIISADSGQVYRGLDIGTAKPSPKERTRASFHLIDIVDPDEPFSAADFRKLALEAIQDIQSRDRSVLVVGGTGLYLKALEGGIFKGPSRNPAIRTELEKQAREEGVVSLRRELEKTDPEAAAHIEGDNRQRIIRALEVHRLTGRPISDFWREHRFGEKTHRFVTVGLEPGREEIIRRIDARVDRMMVQGWVEEVRSLLSRWGGGCPGLRLIGYREIAVHLKDRMTLDEAIRLIKIRTRQYAKRQMTWFRKHQEIRWFGRAEDLINHLTK